MPVLFDVMVRQWRVGGWKIRQGRGNPKHGWLLSFVSLHHSARKQQDQNVPDGEKKKNVKGKAKTEHNNTCVRRVAHCANDEVYGIKFKV